MQRFFPATAIFMAATVCTSLASAFPLAKEQGVTVNKHTAELVITIDTARQNQNSGQVERPCTPRYRRVCEPIYKWKCRQPMYSQCLRNRPQNACRKKACRRAVVGERCRNVQVGTICDTFEQRDRRSPVRPR